VPTFEHPAHQLRQQNGLFTAAGPLEPEQHNPDPPELQVSYLRRRCVDRLTFVSRGLARHRRDQWRTRHRIGPHAIVFFYADPKPGGAEELAIATRIFYDESDEDHVREYNAEARGIPELLRVKILRALIELARDYDDDMGLDPRVQMTDRVEPMSSAATYRGLGVTTVTFPKGVDGEPMSQGLIVLVDGTRVLTTGGHNLDAPDVQSTHTLETGLGLFAARGWRWAWGGDFTGINEAALTAFQDMVQLNRAVARSHELGGLRRRGGRASR
jgi:hypothetical protein